MSLYQYPNDLALLLRRKLSKRERQSVSKEGLQNLLEILLFSSMKTEEAKHIRCRIAFVDPERPDPDQPEVIRLPRWSIVHFAQQLPLTPENLIKVSNGAPFFAADIAVYIDSNNHPFIWGLADQSADYIAYINREKDSVFDRPGIFQIEIMGVGELTVYRRMEIIFTYRRGRIIDNYPNVLVSGPLSQKLWKHNVSLRMKALELASKRCDLDDMSNEQTAAIAVKAIDIWLYSISRILLGIKRQQHGGAILLTNSNDMDDLSVNYKINYNRLCEIIPRIAETEFSKSFFFDKISKKRTRVPSPLYWGESSSIVENDDAVTALTGAINFIVGTSRIDGAILMKKNLSVQGFGVEILTKSEPKKIYVANNEDLHRKDLVEVSASKYGTRHRSMFRYCFTHPSSVGFVVSQDGDIRAITRVGTRIIIWENIRIQGYAIPLDIKLPRRRSSKKTPDGEG